MCSFRNMCMQNTLTDHFVLWALLLGTRFALRTVCGNNILAFDKGAFPSGFRPYWCESILHSLQICWVSCFTKSLGCTAEKTKKISPNVITPPTTAWALHTSQDGSLLSFCVRIFLTLLQQKSRFNRSGRAFQPFIVRFGDSMLAVASVSCSEQTGEIPSVVLCYFSPSALRLEVLHVQRCCSADFGCNQWLFDLTTAFLWPPTSLSILTPGVNKAFSATQLPLTGYFPFLGSFSVNSRDVCDVAKIPVVSATTMQSHLYLHCSILMAKKAHIYKHLHTLFLDVKSLTYRHMMLGKSVSKCQLCQNSPQKTCRINLSTD